MKSKIIFAIIICNFILVFQAPAQGPVLQNIENEIAADKNKLHNVAISAEEKEKLYTRIAYNINQAAEIYFTRAAFEMATKLFVEADAFTKQYHESYYLRLKQQLHEAEQKLSDYEKEKDFAKRETLLKIDRIFIASTLSELITEAGFFQDQTAEKKYLQRLADISKESKDTKGEAKSYEKLGVIEMENNDTATAFELYNKAFSLRKKDNEEWWTLDYIANANWQLGEYDKAAAIFQQEILLLQVLEAKVGIPTTRLIIEKMTIRSSLASAIFSLAQIRMAQGKYGEATKAVTQVEKLLSVFESDKKQNADTVINSLLTLAISTHKAAIHRMLGRILEEQGRTDEALQQYAAAIELFGQLSGGKPSGAIATFRGRMALIYNSQGKFDEARANIREVLRIRSTLHQQTGAVYAMVFASRIEREAKQSEAAFKFARQAKAAALQLSNSDAALAEANETEADILVDRSQDKNSLTLEQAIVNYKTAIEVYRKSELLPALARCLNSLGWAYEKAGKFKEAEDGYTESINITESIRSAFASTEQGDAYGNKRETSQMYQRLVDLLVRQGHTEKALQYATRAQRKSLADILPKNEMELTGKAAIHLNEATVAENRMNTVRASLEKTTAETGSIQKKNHLISALGNARQQYALAIKKLEADRPGLRFTVKPTDLLRIQGSVSPAEAIISYLVTNDKLYIFVVQRATVSVRFVEINDNDLISLVARARNGLGDFAKDFYSISMDPEKAFAVEKNKPDIRNNDTAGAYAKKLAGINSSLTRLYQHLIAPIEDLLTGMETLKIIPNGELFLLPFSALISQKDHQFLVEKYNILFLTAGDLITINRGINKGDLIAFGDPTEADLEGALAEVKEIRSVYPAMKIYTKDAATKVQLFKIKNAKVLHLATHGHILSPLESSNIQLAHLPGTASPDLSYGEIYALPIESMEMVVLSACQTALGSVSGTEIGVFIEAFRSKSNTVVASLWSVDDFATRMLMTEFYKNLSAGKTRVSAMRSAQIKLLNDKRTKNPLFWAAFVLYGGGGKL